MVKLLNSAGASFFRIASSSPSFVHGEAPM
jgi:hypothetical protein